VLKRKKEAELKEKQMCMSPKVLRSGSVASDNTSSSSSPRRCLVATQKKETVKQGGGGQ